MGTNVECQGLGLMNTQLVTVVVSGGAHVMVGESSLVQGRGLRGSQADIQVENLDQHLCSGSWNSW